MKKNLMIAAGLLLLLAAVIWIARDLFNAGDKPSVNPWELDTSALKSGDTIEASHHETLTFRPEMNEIHAIAVDSLDRIYVGGSDGVEVFGAGGNPIFRFSTGDTVICMAFDPSGKLLVSNGNGLQLHDSRGKLLRRIALPSPGALITSLAVTSEEIFLADAAGKVVYRTSPEGDLQNRIGTTDPALGIPGFIVPSAYFDLLTPGDGTVWVVNPGRHALEHYQSTGEPLARWEKNGDGPDGFFGCCNPGHIAMLADGSILTAEKGIVRVKCYTQQGGMIGLVAGPSAFDEGTRGLDLAVDSQDRILVLDPMRKQVRVFIKNHEHEK